MTKLIGRLIMPVLFFAAAMSGFMALDAWKPLAIILSLFGAILYFIIDSSAEAAGFYNDIPDDRFRKHFYSNIQNDPDAPPYMKNAARRVSATHTPRGDNGYRKNDKEIIKNSEE